MSLTYTESQTNTFSEARVHAVMHKTLSDFMVLAASGLVSQEAMLSWHEDLTFFLVHKAAEMFQVRFRSPSGADRALNYRISDDGSLSEDSESGGIDYFTFERGTRVSLTVKLRTQSPHIEKVRRYMTEHGWGNNGQFLEGQTARDRAYSKENFGFIREQVGVWS